MNGYIKLHRCLLSKSIFKNEKLLKVWVWCLLKATHTEKEELVGNQKITLKPGQFYTGRYNASQELGMPPSTVWRYLKILENNQSLDIKSNNKFSVITIENWEFYQIDNKKTDSKADNKWTTNGQQMDTNKNVKNVKNKNIYTVEFEQFWTEYPRKKEKVAAFKMWQRAIKETPPEELIQCATNYRKECEKLQRQPEYIKHPATFLNPDNKKYLDYLKPADNKWAGVKV